MPIKSANIANGISVKPLYTMTSSELCYQFTYQQEISKGVPLYHINNTFSKNSPYFSSPHQAASRVCIDNEHNALSGHQRVINRKEGHLTVVLGHSSSMRFLQTWYLCSAESTTASIDSIRLIRAMNLSLSPAIRTHGPHLAARYA